MEREISQRASSTYHSDLFDLSRAHTRADVLTLLSASSAAAAAATLIVSTRDVATKVESVFSSRPGGALDMFPVK